MLSRYRYDGADNVLYNPFIFEDIKDIFTESLKENKKYDTGYLSTYKLEHTKKKNEINEPEYKLVEDINSYSKIYELLNLYNPTVEYNRYNQILLNNINYIVELLDLLENEYINPHKLVDMTTIYGIHDIGNDIDNIHLNYNMFIKDCIEYVRNHNKVDLYELYTKHKGDNRCYKVIYSI